MTTIERPLSRWERFTLSLHRGLDRHLSPVGVWIMRRMAGRLTRAYKVNALLLTTRGRRSGRERTVVLQYFPDGDGMIVVAANDGGQRYPGWYFNLVADAAGRVEVAGRLLEVRAQELKGADAADWWRRIVEVSPSYERYRRATNRPFPIIRLVPQD
jgi:deazaflavin-dependent oxidoreductase (nitroreductase family)